MGSVAAFVDGSGSDGLAPPEACAVVAGDVCCDGDSVCVAVAGAGVEAGDAGVVGTETPISVVSACSGLGGSYKPSSPNTHSFQAGSFSLC